MISFVLGSGSVCRSLFWTNYKQRFGPKCGGCRRIRSNGVPTKQRLAGSPASQGRNQEWFRAGKQLQRSRGKMRLTGEDVATSWPWSEKRQVLIDAGRGRGWDIRAHIRTEWAITQAGNLTGPAEKRQDRTNPTEINQDITSKLWHRKWTQDKQAR